MTEDNTPWATQPAQDEPNPPVDGSDPAPVEPPTTEDPPEQTLPDSDVPEPASVPDSQPEPEADPAPWSPPVQDQHVTSPEEDASMREERARRFGTGAPEEESAPAQVSQTGSTYVTPIPAAPTQRFNTGAPLPHAEATTAMPAPQPGFPPTSQFDSGQQFSTQTYPGHPQPDTHPSQYGGPDAFEGLEEASTSRAAAHWWGILIYLIFVPVAWYLITDAGARITYALESELAVPISTYIELAGGLVCAFIFLLAARWSSLGPIIIGSLFFAVGVGFLAVPEQGASVLESAISIFGRLGQFGVNVSQHLETTLASARMIFYGFTLIMIGVISHGARRQGRREERLKIALGD